MPSCRRSRLHLQTQDLIHRSKLFATLVVACGAEWHDVSISVNGVVLLNMSTDRVDCGASVHEAPFGNLATELRPMR